jgi:F-type H+-transporting ATPase subunit delta
MLELVRGYAAAVFDEAGLDASLGEVVGDLSAFSGLLVSSEPLRRSLTDAAVPSPARSALLADLLEPRVRQSVSNLATFVALYERAAEFAKTIESLVELGEQRLAEQEVGAGVQPEPPIGRGGALERIRGFAERVFEHLEDQGDVDAIEDELFRLARIMEGQSELRGALSSTAMALSARLSLLSDLLGTKVRKETMGLVGYVLRAGRGRDVVGALNYLVDLAAAERGRRLARVRAAVELDENTRGRLAEALGLRMRRPVELRIVVDPSLLGGLDIEVGDTVIDGTVRHRLEQLRDTILQLN